MDIDDDVLQAAKELAERDDTTAGKVISELARRGLISPRVRREEDADGSKQSYIIKNGVPVFPATGEIVTLEKVRRIMDEEGI